jgi:hypothetical protein
MNAKLAHVVTLAGDNQARSEKRSVALWSFIACACFAGASVCLLAGLIGSVASTLGVIPNSPVAARWTVAVLIAAFVLAFGGAHSLDRLDSVSREE